MIGIQALKVTGNTHSLYYDGTVYETGMNNRLALLGDRVLSLALCEIWFHTDHSNGAYASMSSQTVSRAALAVTGEKLGLHLDILAEGSNAMTSDHIAETLEAVMAAVYVDSGYSMKAVKDVIRTLGIDDHFYLKTSEEMKISDIANRPVNQKSHMSPCEQGTIVTDEQNGPVGRKETDAEDVKLPLTRRQKKERQQQMMQRPTKWSDLAPAKVKLNVTHQRSIQTLENWTAQSHLGEKSAMALRALQTCARLVHQGTEPDPMSIFYEIERAEQLSHLAVSEVSTRELHEPRLEEDQEKGVELGARKVEGKKMGVDFGARKEEAAVPGFRAVKESDDAEEKRVNAEAVERSVRMFSIPKVNSFKSTVKHANSKIEVGTETHRKDGDVVQELQHTVTKEEKAEEVYAVNSTPRKRRWRRFSPLSSTATEPSVEVLEQTTVASHMDAWASLDSEVNTKPSVEFATDRPVFESDMDRFVSGILYDGYHADSVGVATLNPTRAEKMINSDPRTTRALIAVANAIQTELAKRTIRVIRQTHFIRLRIRMAGSSSTTARILSVATSNRAAMRRLFEIIVSTAIKDGLRFDSPAWSTFVTNCLERGEKDPVATRKHMWMAKVREELELFGEENLPYRKPDTMQARALDISTGRFIEAKNQLDMLTTEMQERTSERGGQAVTAQSSEVPKILEEAEKALRKTAGMIRGFKGFLSAKQRLHNRSRYLKHFNKAVVSPGATAAPPAAVPSTRTRRHRSVKTDAVHLPRNPSAKTDVKIRRSRVPPRLVFNTSKDNDSKDNDFKDMTYEDEKRERLAIDDAIKRRTYKERRWLSRPPRKHQESRAPPKFFKYSHPIMRV